MFDMITDDKLYVRSSRISVIKKQTVDIPGKPSQDNDEYTYNEDYINKQREE